MSKLSQCILTANDFSILQVMLERASHRDEAFIRLLRSKLSAATVMFSDDIGPEIATINSRVDYSVDGGPVDNRILAHGEETAFSGVATLPISTLRGLAVLGRSAGETITIEQLNGTMEALRIERLTYQPEAASRKRRIETAPGNRVATQASASVVDFAARRQSAAVSSTTGWSGPDDDDPGPRAA